MTRTATTSAFGLALILSTMASSAQALTLDDVRSTLASGLLPFVSSPARILEARSLYKRYEVCGTIGGTTYYCSSGSCVGLTRCTRGFNLGWIGAIVGAIILCSLIGWCVRRRSMQRAHAAASTSEPVVTVVNPVDPNQQYGQYVAPQPQPGQWVPPKDDPNLAYQTPASYPPAAPGGAPAPGYSPYPPPTSGAPAYPAPAASPYAQPAPYTAPQVSGAPPSPYPPPSSSPYAQPAPYPVPQGEAGTYVPPKP